MLSHQAPQQNHCSTCSRHKAPSHFQAQKHRGLLILQVQPNSLPDPAALKVLSQLINHAWHLVASPQHSIGVWSCIYVPAQTWLKPRAEQSWSSASAGVRQMPMDCNHLSPLSFILHYLFARIFKFLWTWAVCIRSEEYMLCCLGCFYIAVGDLFVLNSWQ